MLTLNTMNRVAHVALKKLQFIYLKFYLFSLYFTYGQIICLYGKAFLERQDVFAQFLEIGVLRLPFLRCYSYHVVVKCFEYRIM